MRHKNGIDENSAFSTFESKLGALMSSEPALPSADSKRIWHKARALVPEPRPVRRFPKAIFYPAFAAMLIIGFLSGYGSVVVAASASIPGDPFYPIERQAETVWMSLTPDAQRCQVAVVLLQRRVYEAKALLEAGKYTPDSLLQEIEMLFLSVAEETQCQTQVPDLLAQVTDYQHQIGKLVERYPGIEGLNRAFDAANIAVVKLGGEPLDALPRKLAILFS
ncbi:MAG: hypothetical protein JXA21_28595 [Anaerolineae bacterium]|nr:hypothetical protein [Anaerolineae bacterium]